MLELMRERLVIDWLLLTRYWYVWLSVVLLAVALGTVLWALRRRP